MMEKCAGHRSIFCLQIPQKGFVDDAPKRELSNV